MTDGIYLEEVRQPVNDLLDRIISFETGELGHEETIELFQELIDSGLIHSLQGSYGRLAQHLISADLCHI